jgi:DNA-directed RNA polymerase specialized sigma24 family protein
VRELPYDPSLIDDPWWHKVPAGDPPLDPEVVERIKDSVEALPEDERAVVECLIWGQMTKVEVAEMLGRTRQWVYEVEKRALAMLATVLGGIEEE